MKKLLLIAGGFLLLAAAISGVWATLATNRQQTTQVIEADGSDWASGPALQYLTQQSELIITGRCLGTHSIWIGRELFTAATIEVGKTIKGDSSSRLTVNFPGGVDIERKVPVRMSYPDAPSIHTGENVLLFAKQTPDGYALTGFDGKFSIVNDRGQTMVSRDPARASLQGGTPRAVPLAELEGRIRQYLQ